MIYDNLTNRELDNLRKAYFGNVLDPISKIGRNAVIEKLRTMDAILFMREKYPGFVVATTKKREKEFKEAERYILWKTSSIQFHIPLREFMAMK